MCHLLTGVAEPCISRNGLSNIYTRHARETQPQPVQKRIHKLIALLQYPNLQQRRCRAGYALQTTLTLQMLSCKTHCLFFHLLPLKPPKSSTCLCSMPGKSRRLWCPVHFKPPQLRNLELSSKGVLRNHQRNQWQSITWTMRKGYFAFQCILFEYFSKYVSQV